MEIIMGASGRVGNALVRNLLSMGEKVKAVIRDKKKAEEFEKNERLSIAIADAFNLRSLIEAFAEGEAVFLLTPESGESQDVLGDTKLILDSYKQAIERSSIKRLIGLSSMGAHLEKNTGNLIMSYMLEHHFDDLDITRTFIRPAYYFSNWLNFVPLVKEQKIIPSFFPPDLKIPMVSPLEIASFAADVIKKKEYESKIYEVEGPEWYSTNDIAGVFSEIMGFKVETSQITRENWWNTIKEFGFTDDATKNFIEMTQAVVDGKTNPQKKGTIGIKLKTSFKEYLKSELNK